MTEVIKHNARVSWDQAMSKAHEIRDLNDTEIDKGVLELVAAFIALEIPTENSCGGHLHHPRSSEKGKLRHVPYVSFEARNSAEFKKRFDELSRKLGVYDDSSTFRFTQDPEKQKEYFESDEFKALRAAKDQAEKEVMEEVRALLNDFYSDRPKDGPRIEIDGLVIRCSGATGIDSMSDNDWSGYLKQCQFEFEQFTQFLKKQIH